MGACDTKRNLGLGLVLTLFVSSCVLSGCREHSPPPRGLTTGSPPLWIESPTSQFDYWTDQTSVQLMGTVDSSCWGIDWQGRVAVCTRVTWKNLSTDQSGKGATYAHVVCLFRCWVTEISWSAIVPLEPGDNLIEVWAQNCSFEECPDRTGSEGRDEILVHCTPMGVPVWISEQNADGSVVTSFGLLGTDGRGRSTITRR